MDIAYIDHLANSGDSYLHRSSPAAKMLLSGSVITAIILSDSINAMLSIYIILLVLIGVAKLPILKILHFSLYPAFFSLIFAFIRLTYSVEAGLTVIIKALDAATAMFIVITTTPYPDIFSFFRLLLPGVIVDGMFFTYRIFFILLEKVGNTLTVMKLKGGFNPSKILFNIRNLAGVMGVLFIHAFDMSQRMYNIYALRGYEGSVFQKNNWYEFKRIDVVLILTGIIILLLVVAL